MKNDEVLELETSLKNFFLNSNEVTKDKLSSSNIMKYRGLSMEIEEGGEDGHIFKVRIGAFEAKFRIRDGLKIHGSLCGDEKIVIKWYYRGSNQQMLQSLAGKTSSEPTKTVETNYAGTDLKLDGKSK